MRRPALCLILGLWPLFVPAQVAVADESPSDSGLETLLTADDSRGWEAVGRIDIAGRAFCTGSLIAPDLVLTAAHCLYDKDSRTAFSPEDFRFLAGWRNGRAIAYRGIRAIVPHPSYRYLGPESIEAVPYDLAILRLDQPIRLNTVRPFGVGTDPMMGDRLEVVSYAFDRADAPSLQESCRLIGPQPGMNVFSCSVDFGSSGAPIFRIEDGKPQIVSVVSAKAELDGVPVSLGAQLGMPFVELKAAVDAAEGTGGQTGAGLPQIAPVDGGGIPAASGAKFLRP